MARPMSDPATSIPIVAALSRRPPSANPKAAPIAPTARNHQPNAEVIRSPAHGVVTPPASGRVGGGGAGSTKFPVLLRKKVQVGSPPATIVGLPAAGATVARPWTATPIATL